MTGFVLRRLLFAIPTLLVMLTAIFVLVRMVPGDAAQVVLGDQASAASLAALRAKLGLDQPVYVQYVSFLLNVVRGDLGQSLSSGRSVVEEVRQVLPSTIELTAAAIVIGLLFGLPLGVAAALSRNGWIDYVSRVVSLIGLSFPAFVSGILMLIVFAIQLGWFPVLGGSGGRQSFAEHLRGLALPALNLGLIMTAYVMRVTRAAMLGVLTEDYSYGRDVLSRLIYGARVSLFVGFAAILVAMLVGTTIGVISGYVGGLFDQIVMGVLDVMLAFPTLLLGLMIAAMLGASLENLIIAIAVTEIAPFARVARAPTISLRERDFVEACRSYGCGPVRIMTRHILPNMMSDVVVMSSLWLASAIRTEASLSFIGLGVPPPTATWGSMIREGFENILDAWWLAVFPSLAILVTVLALNLLGDALRDASDPRTQSR